MNRLLALVVHELDVPGDPEQGAAPVRGLDLEIEAGTLVFLTPPERGRTVILYLSGQLAPRPARHEHIPRTGGIDASGWRCVVPAAAEIAEPTTRLQEHLE